MSGPNMSGSFSFRLTGRVYAAENCTMLYRGVDAEAMTTNHLFLTRDGRFAYLARVIGGKGLYAAEEWSADRAKRFLVQHGEGDLVEEFPEIFRLQPRAVKMSVERKPVVAPKGRPAEPFLFPLH
jgi:hypothetical protein